MMLIRLLLPVDILTRLELMGFVRITALENHSFIEEYAITYPFIKVCNLFSIEVLKLIISMKAIMLHILDILIR